ERSRESVRKQTQSREQSHKLLLAVWLAVGVAVVALVVTATSSYNPDQEEVKLAATLFLKEKVKPPFKLCKQVVLNQGGGKFRVVGTVQEEFQGGKFYYYEVELLYQESTPKLVSIKLD